MIQPVTELHDGTKESLIAALEGWLEDARAGRLTGCVLLGKRRGDGIQHYWAGHIDAASVAWDFECWKRDALALVQREDE